MNQLYIFPILESPCNSVIKIPLALHILINKSSTNACYQFWGLLCVENYEIILTVPNSITRIIIMVHFLGTNSVYMVTIWRLTFSKVVSISRINNRFSWNESIIRMIIQKLFSFSPWNSFISYCFEICFVSGLFLYEYVWIWVAIFYNILIVQCYMENLMSLNVLSRILEHIRCCFHALNFKELFYLMYMSRWSE